MYRISKAREDKRLAKHSWQHTLALFRGCVLDLTTNVPQFSLAHSCVITTIPMSDSIIWLFLFNQPSPQRQNHCDLGARLPHRNRTIQMP